MSPLRPTIDEVAVAIERTDVACPQPAIPQHLRGQSGCASSRASRTGRSPRRRRPGPTRTSIPCGRPAHGSGIEPRAASLGCGPADRRTLRHRVPHDQRDPDALRRPAVPVRAVRERWRPPRSASAATSPGLTPSTIEQLGPLGRHRTRDVIRSAAEDVEHPAAPTTVSVAPPACFPRPTGPRA